MKQVGLSHRVVVLATLSAVLCAGAAGARSPLGPPAGPTDFGPPRLLVKLREGSGPLVRFLAGRAGARVLGQQMVTGVQAFELPAGAPVQAWARAFAGRSDVEWVEVDQRLAPTAVPNDTYYPASWHLPKVNAPACWDRSTGNSDVIIAIIDTGVDGSHPDLQSKLVPGWNIYNNNADTSDVHGHGTAVAGAAGAASNNTLGVASVAWGCRLMPVRVSDPAGYASFNRISRGLIWAADRGARVANVSYRASQSLAVRDAAAYFQSKGGVVTIGAGNDGATETTTDTPYILTVSGTDQTDTIWSSSNRGPHVDIAAPAVQIVSTGRGGGYVSGTGTSMSGPLVAGVAALCLSVNPSLSPAELQDVLAQSADDLGPEGRDPAYGWGRLNAGRAVLLAQGDQSGFDVTAPSVVITGPTDASTVAGVVSVSASASDEGGLGCVHFAVNGTVRARDDSAPYSFDWDTRLVLDGVYTLTATAQDVAGNQSSHTVQVTVKNKTDGDAPEVTITKPTDGTSVTSTVYVYVDARDNVGVTRVDLYVDGSLKAYSSVAPFTTTWNARYAATGPHKLQVKARDADGNSAWSQVVTVDR